MLIDNTFQSEQAASTHLATHYAARPFYRILQPFSPQIRTLGESDQDNWLSSDQSFSVRTAVSTSLVLPGPA
jgi:hypothetical protein